MELVVRKIHDNRTISDCYFLIDVSAGGTSIYKDNDDGEFHKLVGLPPAVSCAKLNKRTRNYQKRSSHIDKDDALFESLVSVLRRFK